MKNLKCFANDATLYTKCSTAAMKLIIEHDGLVLKQAESDELRDDRMTVLSAVKKRAYALECASKRLQNDRQVVLCAVKHHGCALKYASDELRNNLCVVACAVRQDGRALEYASNDMRIVM